MSTERPFALRPSGKGVLVHEIEPAAMPDESGFVGFYAER